MYFRSCEHPEVRAYVERLVTEGLPHVSGQLAFDFIQTDNPPRLVAIECNPRATSGIHLYSGTPTLALALTRAPHLAQQAALAKPGARRQLAPGMLMWKRSKSDHRCKTAMKEYVRHMIRLTTSKDVIFSKRDLMPSLMQPFLLTSYYEICREKKLKLPTMFQYDLTWEPRGDELREVRRMFEEPGRDEGEESDGLSAELSK